MPFIAPADDLAQARGGTVNQFGDLIPGTTPASGRRAQDIGDSLIAGLQNSATGLAVRGKLPSMQLSDDSPWYHRLAAAGAGIAADLPLSIAGAVGGAAAGTAVAPGAGTLIGGGAGAFAAPMALRDALIEVYNGDHALSWSGAWEIAKSAMKGGAKGAAIGAVTGGAGGAVLGKFAGGLQAPAMGAVEASLGRQTVATGAEFAGLMATSAAVEQHMPTWQDFMDNAILLGGMKAAVGVAKNMRNNYAETGKLPAEQLADAAKDPTITLDMKPVEARATNEKMVEVFHGSPHEFEKFDAAKIGTGEGAQAYGHGLYFAENEAVSKDYQHNVPLSNMNRGETPTIRLSTGEALAARSPAWDALFGTWGQKVGETRKNWMQFGDKYKAELDAIKGIPDDAVPSVGSLYKVQIPQRVVDAMLDWDKPFTELPKAQQDALTKLYGKPIPESYNASNNPESGYIRATMTGGDAYDLVAKKLLPELPPDSPNAPRGWQFVQRGDEGQRHASEQLKALGITGIRYLDRLSRDNGTGTSNYVLFDAEHARVVERNGQPIGTTQAPRAYAPLALEERIKAAIDADPRPEMIHDIIKGNGPAKLGENGLNDPVKYEYISDNETAKGVLRDVTAMYGAEIADQTRGVVLNKQTAVEALKLVTDGVLTEHVIGEAGNAAEIYARAHLLRGATNHAVAELNKLADIPAADLSPAMKISALAALERVTMLKAEVEGVGAEAGRALQIFRAIKRDPSYLGEANTLLALAERKGSLQDIAGLMKALKDPAQIAKFADGYTKATTMEKVVEAWRASIVSGPMTVQANVIGNVVKFGVDIPEAMVRASLAAVSSRLAGEPMAGAQFKARALAPIHGLMLAVQDGLTLSKAALDTINEGGLQGVGELIKQANKALAGSDPSKVESFRQANEGAFGEIVQIPFKLLKLTDMPFRNIGERAEAYIMAVDRVVKEGKLHPDTAEFKAQVAEYVAHPETGLSEAAAIKALAQIEGAGAVSVFSERLGPKMEGLQRLMAGTWASFVVPFVRTPANLVSWAIQHVPGLNLMSARWRADWEAGGERKAAALARVVTGTALTVSAMSLAEQGTITGGGLFDKEDSGTKRGAGWQPYSLFVDGKYYSIQRLEPVAKVLGLAADMYEMLKAYKGQPEEQAKLFTMSVFMFSNATISTTYLSGLANTIDAARNPDRYFETWMEQYASSVVPKAVGQTVAMRDPYMREVNGALDAIQSQLPFLREKLLPKRDVWGETTKQGRLFDVMPLNTSEAATEKVKTEAMRLGLAIADVPKFIQEKGPFEPKDERIKLSPEQRDVFKEVAGKSAMSILAPIVNAPDWNHIPDFAKAAIYKDVIEGARKQGQYASLPADAEARMKLREQIVEKIIKQTREADEGVAPAKRVRQY